MRHTIQLTRSSERHRPPTSDSRCSMATTPTTTASTTTLPEPAAPLDTAAAAATAPAAHVEPIHTCRYPSKKCWNTRALKRNGEMHNLCDLHREKANKNQRRLEQKRKTSKKIAATAKRARKSRAAAKSKTARVAATRAPKQPLRQQQQQSSQPKKSSTTATNSTPTKLSAAANVLQQQQQTLQLMQTQTHMQSLVGSSASSLPTGFFTDLMMSDTMFAKQPNVSWTPMAPLQQQPPSHMYQSFVKPTSTVNVDDLLDGDLDSLTHCLDSIPQTASLGFPAPHVTPSSSSMLGLVGGSSSPIDVCDGLDAVAAVSDFWWHPVVVNVDPVLDMASSSMSDELFASQLC